jgi:hypothetical protein
MAEHSGMRCRLHREQTEVRPLFGTQLRPTCIASVDLAGLARGVTDPPSIPEFSISTPRAYPARDVARSNVDAPQPTGSYPVDHDGESIGRRRVASFVHLPGIG